MPEVPHPTLPCLTPAALSCACVQAALPPSLVDAVRDPEVLQLLREAAASMQVGAGSYSEAAVLGNLLLPLAAMYHIAGRAVLFRAMCCARIAPRTQCPLLHHLGTVTKSALSCSKVLCFVVRRLSLCHEPRVLQSAVPSHAVLLMGH
jgi:hypothetical protein